MKVLLIQPPIKNMVLTNTPSMVDEEQGYYPPLGLMYLSGYAEQHSGHDIAILDCELDSLSYADINKEIKKQNPDIVGLTTTTFNLIDALKVVDIVKHNNPNTKVVMGGPHVNIFPEETLDLKGVDYIVLGEGEVTFTELTNAIDKKKNISKIQGIAYKQRGKIIRTKSRPLISDLDQLPFPARQLTKYKRYYSLLAKREPITTMITSRGCPYKCIFCDRPHLGKIFRIRSAVNVVDEMEFCVNMGIKEFLIYDDTFTINRKRVIDVCNEIMRRGLKIGWDIRARVDTVDKESLYKLKKAGCERIHYGVEASNQHILDNLRKDITLKQVGDAFRVTKKIGIETLAYFMIGSPGETRKTIIQTIKFAKKLKPDYVHYSVTSPFPGTDLYKLALQRGVIKEDVWREFAKNPTRDFKAPLWTEKLTRTQLMDLLMYAYKSFYTRPNYIAQKLLRIRSVSEFKRKVKAGLRIFSI